jgi:ABC-type glycerol-3-phosphate transport system substrate-binding protein
MKRREEEFRVIEALRSELRRGRMDRRQFLTRVMATGFGLAGISAALAACGGGAAPAQQASSSGGAAESSGRALTPTYYDWIPTNHPGVRDVTYSGELNFQIAPVEGFGIERFVTESKAGESTWDIYVGMTPFVEMTQLIEADVIEPWDPYIPKDVLDDLIPSIRDECTINGKLYSWPFLLDVISMGYNSELTDKAGVPDTPPGTWAEYLDRAQQVVDSGAALYGATFDAHGWRSVAPFTHSLTSDVYTSEGRFDFNHDAVVEALLLMEKIMKVSHPDILLEGASDGGVNGTPDEVTFAARKVAYYTKYQNAPLRFAANWPDPDKLRLGALPKFEGGEGSTVFWTTGCGLFKHGKNKEAAADYLKNLTSDPQIWQDSIGGTETGHAGHLPPYQSIYADWNSNRPDWLLPFVGLIRDQLDVAKAITNHLVGLSQFQIGKPHWEEYLTGEESDPKVALKNTWDAVTAELEKSG